MAPPATFFAQADRARFLFQEAFPQKGRDSAEVLSSMAIVVLAFASSIAFVYFLRHMRTGMRRSPSIQATRLFTHCLRRLDLRLTDRVLLRLAARRCALRQPTVMLFSPELLERHAGEWAAELPIVSLRPWATRRIQALTTVLFGNAPVVDAPARQPDPQ